MESQLDLLIRLLEPAERLTPSSQVPPPSCRSGYDVANLSNITPESVRNCAAALALKLGFFWI